MCVVIQMFNLVTIDHNFNLDIHKQTFNVVSFISHPSPLDNPIFFENLDWIIMVRRWQKAFSINRLEEVISSKPIRKESVVTCNASRVTAYLLIIIRYVKLPNSKFEIKYFLKALEHYAFAKTDYKGPIESQDSIHITLALFILGTSLILCE